MSIAKNGSFPNSKAGFNVYRYVASEGQMKFDLEIMLTQNVLVLVNGSEAGLNSVSGYGSRELSFSESLFEGDSVTVIG
jgi:hypothetical protein